MLTHKKGCSGGKDDRPVWIEFHDLNPEKTRIGIRSGRAVALPDAQAPKVEKRFAKLLRFVAKNGGQCTRDQAVRYFKSTDESTVERWLAGAVVRGYLTHAGKGEPYVMAAALAA